MWADAVAEQAEAAWATPGVCHPAAAYLEQRGLPQGTGGVGLGIDLPADCPPHFLAWAEKFRWLNSLIIIVRDWRGAVTGFQIRQPDEKLYIRYDIYDPAVAPPFFGAELAFDHVWTTGHLILTEGPFDALACRLVGAKSAVATLGAMPSRASLRWVQRLATRVTALFDTDDAGRKACDRLRQELRGVIVSTPTYAAHDPWDLYRLRPEALARLVG